MFLAVGGATAPGFANGSAVKGFYGGYRGGWDFAQGAHGSGTGGLLGTYYDRWLQSPIAPMTIWSPPRVCRIDDLSLRKIR